MKKAHQADLKKLKAQLKGKEEEILKLEVGLLAQKEQNEKLQATNQNLTGKVNQMVNAKTKKKEAAKGTQTEKLPTRNVMVGTLSAVGVQDQEVQVELLVANLSARRAEEESDTPQKDE